MTNDTEIAQQESSLYMPSMYESDDDDEDDSNHFRTDARDESTCSDIQRSGKRRRLSRYSLMRCLAWSHTEDDINDADELERDREENPYEDLFVVRHNSGGCSSFSSVHSAMIDTVRTPPDDETSPVHWEERVGSDRKIDSYIVENENASNLSKC